MDLDSFTLEQALGVLGQRLSNKGLRYELVAVGGASLVLLGQIERSTKDIDLVAIRSGGELVSPSPMPPDLLAVIEEVGEALNLGKEWLNTGPASLLDLGLPEGFAERLIPRHYDTLTLHCTSRRDQICFKLYAAVDQGPDSKHYADLKWLEPSDQEIEGARAWYLRQDVSPSFAEELDQTVNFLRSHGNAT